jgi:7SK snRNA methylphosphate capping enzyme
MRKAKRDRDRDDGSEFGNFKDYYGSLKRVAASDQRLEHLPGELFAGKDVLDVGCNEGVVSLSVWARFKPRTLVGVDLDGQLVAKARRNRDDFRGKRQTHVTGLVEAQGRVADRTAFRDLEGLSFEEGNAVTGAERAAESVDAVLLLSVTKWIQLQHGDAGLKEAFARIWRSLRPGGVLVLEPQPLQSYKKRKKRATQAMREHLRAMQLLPEAFPAYLCDTVGFVLLATHHPDSESKGFRRPLYVFQKPAALAN